MAIKKIDKTFREITGQILTISSRLKMFNILQDTEYNTYFMNIFRDYKIADYAKGNNVYFDLYTCEDEDWWDNISFKHYNTERLWWLVCEMNDIVNPFEEIDEGLQVKVLKEDYLYNVFKAISTIAQL